MPMALGANWPMAPVSSEPQYLTILLQVYKPSYIDLNEAFVLRYFGRLVHGYCRNTAFWSLVDYLFASQLEVIQSMNVLIQ